MDNPICEQFQTPEIVCDYMVRMIPADCVTILEPTPGMGHIVKSLKKHHFREIEAPEDFFLLGPDIRKDATILNPPFSSKSANLENAPENLDLRGMRVGYHILERCMNISDNVIALMPWFTISDSDVRLRKLMDFGLVSLTALPRKTFEYVRIQTVVIQLQKGYKGETAFRTLDLRIKK
jgi:hypothetical protein